MSNCCCAGKPSDSNAVRCPASGSIGTAVDLQTVKAFLTETALRGLKPADYRFCVDATCPVVYFDSEGTWFCTADFGVAVWQKELFGARPVCYCFGESEATITAEIKANGRSLAVERVREHIDAGRCACEIRKPRGACCLVARCSISHEAPDDDALFTFPPLDRTAYLRRIDDAVVAVPTRCTPVGVGPVEPRVAMKSGLRIRGEQRSVTWCSVGRRSAACPDSPLP